jgi:hypothetical protein
MIIPRAGTIREQISQDSQFDQGSIASQSGGIAHQITKVSARVPVVPMNMEKMTAVLNQIGRVLKTEGKVDMICSLFDEMSKAYGIKKATFYAVSSNYENCFKKI